jgi:DNA-binding beta-propeller fold protein YncE
VPVVCDDGDPCTLDECAEGSCWAQWILGCFCRDASDCDDGDVCTLDSCTGGRCVHGTAALPGCCGADADCDDGDPCTLDRCDGTRCRVDPAPDPACCDPVPLHADFEGGSADPFELDPAGPDGIGWHVMPAPVGTGNALVFGDATGSGYDDGDRVFGTATSPWVMLPADVSLELAFRTWQDVESVPGQDPFQVEAVTREGSTSVAWSRPAGFAMRTWKTVSVDLSAMAGRTIRLRFRFDTVDGTANAGRGVIVDDVGITGPCQPRGCQRGSDCTSLGWHAACRSGACDYRDALSTRSTPGDPGTGISFTGPSDVAVVPDGSRVYVSDRDAHRVLVLDAGGRPTGEVIGSAGTAAGQFQLPRGLAADADHLYVADSGNHRIQAFTPAGVFLWALGSKGDAPGRFNEPKGLGLSADGDVLWVADTSNHRVQGFSPWGVVRVVIGSYGREDGQFRSPSCAVPLPDGGVLVCDTQNNRLQVFQASGAHRATFAPDDGIPLTQPYGAAVAGEGRFWVSDTYNHRLVLLDVAGRVDDRYGRAGGGVGGFSYPLGMESDPSGGLWVVDSGNRRVVALVRGPVP